MLFTLGSAFRIEVTDLMVDAYLVGLEDIPWEKLAAGGREALKVCKYFPTVAKLRELAKPVVLHYHQPARIEEAPKPGTTKYWGDPTPISNAEMVEVCLGNARKAADEEAASRARYRVMQPGAAGITDCRLDILRHHQDQAHWQEYAEYYRRRGEQEGPDTLVPLPAGMRGRAGRENATERKPERPGPTPAWSRR
jgi:hypothetical protein